LCLGGGLEGGWSGVLYQIKITSQEKFLGLVELSDFNKYFFICKKKTSYRLRWPPFFNFISNNGIKKFVKKD